MRPASGSRSSSSGVGVEVGGELFSLQTLWALAYGPSSYGGAFPSSIDAMIERDMLRKGLPGEVSATLIECGPGTRERMMLPKDATFAPPLMRPGKILAVARNYRAHAAEMGSEAPPELRWFLKIPSTVIPSGAPIEVPAWLEGEVHHEAELALVIGKPAKNLSEAEAPEVIAGYTVLNDVTARGMQAEAKQQRMPWDAAKNLDGFCPMGPFFVLSESIANPANLAVECRVNGEVRQQGNTSDMMHSVAKIVSDLSKHLTLLPGDVIATGTPEGVGALNDGDVVECEIESIGVLRNPVVRGS